MKKIAAVILLTMACFSLYGETVQPHPDVDSAVYAEARQTMERAVEVLLLAQKADGSYQSDPAITALCVLALAKSNVTIHAQRIDQAVKKGITFFMKFQTKDGSFSKAGRYTTYTTSIVLSTLAQLDLADTYRKEMLAARHFILDQQLDEDHPLYPTTDSSPYKGGIGYGSKGPSRPDLSNTQLALEALYLTRHLEGEDHPEGSKKESLAWKNAVQFLEACQNVPESADGTWVVPADADTHNDGGFVYKPDEAKTSPEGKGLRSYGSMTYAGLKSMIYANLTKDDYRVKAARQWAADHYTVDENPGMGAEGLYYYFQTFARANSVFGETYIVGRDGTKHAWRNDLLRKLNELEKEGAWPVAAGRWMESLPELIAAYALLSYEAALE